MLRGFGGHAGIIDDASGWNVRVATHGHGAGAHIHASMMYVVLKNTMNILLAQHVASVMLHSQRLQTERRLQQKAVDSEGRQRKAGEEGWRVKALEGRLAREGWQEKAGDGRMAMEGWQRKAGNGRLATEG